MLNRRALLVLVTAIAPAPAPVLAQALLAQAPVRVVASFSILADFVKAVGGERVEVSTIVGANGDAHVYEPTPRDGKKLGAARVVFVNGLGFEGWIDRLIAASKTKARIVTASASARTRADGGGVDPHAWQDARNAKIYVANIRDALVAADPEGKEIYDANADAYLVELAALDDEIGRAIATIPKERRRIVSTHDAFGYFAQRYGLEFIAPQGVSTESEPSARDVSRIIEAVKAHKVGAVFLENVVDPRLTRRIAAETGVKIGGALYSDALSDANGPAATYIDLMRHNVGELTKALAP